MHHLQMLHLTFHQLLFTPTGIHQVVVLVVMGVELVANVFNLVVVEGPAGEECNVSATNVGMSPNIVGPMGLVHTPVGHAIITSQAMFGGQLLKINTVDLRITVLVPPEKLGAIL